MDTYADYYLRFSDKATATAILYTTHPEVVDEEGTVVAEVYVTPNYANIDTIGILYAEPVSEGADPVPLDGWHVNVRIVVGAEDATPLVPYAVLPQHPRRIWAGGMYPAPIED